MDTSNGFSNHADCGHRVLMNHEGLHALWADDLPIPDGWQPIGAASSRDASLKVIAERWPTLRPAGRLSGSTVHQLFRRKAAQSPSSIAVIDDHERLTYGELDQFSDRLAKALRDHGARADVVIPVCLDRRADMIVALLAVLKAGAAFLPLDPAHPATRIGHIVADAEATVAITTDEYAPAVGVPFIATRGHTSTALLSDGSAPDDLAYLIYTSGTTGTPKGIAVSHRNMLLTIVRAAKAYRLTPGDHVLQIAALGSDTAVEQIFAPLLSGATIVLGGHPAWSTSEFVERASHMSITVADLTPTYWHQVLSLASASSLSSLRLLIVGGDTVHSDDCRTTLRALPQTTLLNAYGLTETGITSTLATIAPAALADPHHPAVPIGRPLAGGTAHVLDADLRPVRPGERGEIFIGGHGLARGFWRDPVLTAEYFLPEPYAGRTGTRMYRTGDTGYWRPDGHLALLGRSDDQVKVRGYRVSPAEVESHLSAHPGVGQASVVAAKSLAGLTTLAAYFTSTQEGADPQQIGHELRTYLMSRLPEHLVPTSFIPVERMPVTGNGKIDRRQLALLTHHPVAARPPVRKADGNPTDEGLALLWAQVLGIEDVSADDDFFDLGGNSLMAMDMLARARLMYGLGVEHIRDLTRALLSAPTLAAFSAALQSAIGSPGTPAHDQKIDFTGEAVLGVPVQQLDVPAQPPRHVLVTGATGFCGTHLLHALLASGGAEVHCLVRASDLDHAQERLRAAHQHFLGRDLDTARIHPVLGDLTRPLLGLDRAGFEHLARTVDAIYHLGGQVNFLYPYHQLRTANVSGTREIIRLAGHWRNIPVHYLSTMAVLAGFGSAGIRHVTEDTPLAYPERLGVGYVESKWTAEVLLQNASAAGLPVSIYRVNDVTGDLTSGIMNTGTELCALIKYFDDTGDIPEVDLPLDFVPADRFTQALVHLATRAPAVGAVYHLTNPGDAPLSLLADRIRARGRTITTLPYSRWTKRLLAYTAQHPEHPICPFLPLFVDHAPDSDLTISEMYFRPTFPRFSAERAEQALGAAEIGFPPVDDVLLDFYLHHLDNRGYLAPAT